MSPDSSITIGGQEIDPVRGGLLFLFVGLAVAGYGVYDYSQQQRALSSAEPVNATIIETGVETQRSSSKTDVEYVPTVQFEYTYRGESYTSTNVYPASVKPSYDRQSGARAVVDEYERNTTVTAYAVPDEPDDAFLRNEGSSGPLVAVGLGVVLLLLGGQSVISGYRRS